MAHTHTVYCSTCTGAAPDESAPRCLDCERPLGPCDDGAFCLFCQEWLASFQCPDTGESIHATYRPIAGEGVLWLEPERDPSEESPDTAAWLRAIVADCDGATYYASTGAARIVVEDGAFARTVLYCNGVDPDDLC